jgi:hypothetical protein
MIKTNSAFDFDWDSLPMCGTQGLVVSPNFCRIDPIQIISPINQIAPIIPTGDVPTPGAGFLFASALALLIARKSRQTPKSRRIL